MKDFIPIIRSAPLFAGISDDELSAMLSCLDAKEKSFPKDSFLLRAGDTTEQIGIVISGKILIIQEDIWGNRNIISTAASGQTFGVAFACAIGSTLNVSVVAETVVSVLFLNVNRILRVCSSACEHHNKIIRNLLGDLADKNLRFSEKLTYISQRTTRAKLMSYLSAEAKRLGKIEFDIPFSRQQLADYLAVERSGLSLELGKMRDEGLLEFNKNHFILKI
jgi:CRP/FNR family transcriptional regulator, cyclic AMP receptor protein